MTNSINKSSLKKCVAGHIVAVSFLFLVYGMLNGMLNKNPINRNVQPISEQTTSQLINQESLKQSIPLTRQANDPRKVISQQRNETEVSCKLSKRKDNERKTEQCERRLPKVILVGSQKSGTSAFTEFLNFHPQIAACRKPDEPRYFTARYNNHSLEWYRKLMPCSYRNQLTMEKTPGYFYSNITAQRIKQMNENTTILMIFKDPVEVAISIFAMWKAHEEDIVYNKTFEDVVTVLDEEGNRKVNSDSLIIQNCKYVQYAKMWFDVFGKERIYAIDGMAFDKHPLKELKLLEKFLGIQDFFKKEHFIFNKDKKKFCFARTAGNMRCLPSAKGRPHPDVSEETRSLLNDYFKPYNEEFAKLFHRSFAWL